MISPTAKYNQAQLNKLRRILFTLSNKIKNIQEKTPFQLAKMGAHYATSIAPYYEGATMKSIAYKTGKGNEAIIYVDEATLFSNGSNRRRTTPVNYVKIMHRTQGNMGRGVRIKSGDPTFMYTTRKYLKQRLNEKLKISLAQ